MNKRGDILILTSGFYEDYGVIGLVEVLEDFDDDVLDSIPISEDESYYIAELRLAYLIDNGLVKYIPHSRLFMGP